MSVYKLSQSFITFSRHTSARLYSTSHRKSSKSISSLTISSQSQQHLTKHSCSSPHIPNAISFSTTTLFTSHNTPSIYTAQQRHLNFLKKRIMDARMRGLRGAKEEEKWDPWDSAPRDHDLKPEQSDMILQTALRQRQKQLDRIAKFQKKEAEKEARIKTPVAYAQQLKANKIPFSKKVKNAFNWIKNPRNYLHRYCFHIEDPEQLTLFQKCIFIHWKWTLLGTVIFFATFPRIPAISSMLSELSRHRNRKSRGVLGLDEYCHPAKQNVDLLYIRTGDFSFDIRYLQKMLMRDLFVLDNLNTTLQKMTDRRLDLLKKMIAKLEEFEKDPNIAQNARTLTSFQRDAILNLTQYHQSLSNEVAQCEQLLGIIGTEWASQIDSVRQSIDIQHDTLFNVYLIQEYRRDQKLKKMIETSQQILDWRRSLEIELDLNLKQLETVHEVFILLCGDNSSRSGFDSMWDKALADEYPFPGLITPLEISLRKAALSDQSAEKQALDTSKTAKRPADLRLNNQAMQEDLDLVQSVLSGDFKGDLSTLPTKKYSQEELDDMMSQFKEHGADFVHTPKKNKGLPYFQDALIDQDNVDQDTSLDTFLEKSGQPADVDGYLKQLQLMSHDHIPSASTFNTQNTPVKTGSQLNSQEERMSNSIQRFSTNNTTINAPATVNTAFSPKKRDLSDDIFNASLQPQSDNLQNSSSNYNTMSTPPGAQTLFGGLSKSNPSSSSSSSPRTSLSSKSIKTSEPGDEELAQLVAFKESKNISARRLAEQQIQDQKFINQQYSQGKS